MKLFEKYKQLQDKTFLVNMLTNSVYATMQLESQPVKKTTVQEIVLSVLKDEALKGHKFTKD
jgi:hypothetical protein